MTSRTQEFVPQSHSKAEQIVTNESDIFTNKQKSEFTVFNLVENTRQLLTEEIIHRMYPSEVLSRINEKQNQKKLQTILSITAWRRPFCPGR